MPEINRNVLQQNIRKESFDRVYLIYGEEKMYIKIDTDALITKLIGKNPPDFNYHSFSKDYNLEEIAVAVQVVPFMSRYNVVKIADLDFNEALSDEIDTIKSIIDNVPEGTVLIFTMPTLAQNPKSLGANFKKILNHIKKKGTVCAVNHEEDIPLARQIIKWADSRGIKIEQADAYKLQEYVGKDLNMIRNELDKLCNYVGDKGIITTEDIELLVTKNLEANIFHLTDNIISGNAEKAYGILDTLFYQKADANEIISVISMAYIDYYRARVANECGVQLSTVAKDFSYGKREFVLKNAVNKTRRISTPMLRESLSEISEATQRLRSSSSNDRILLEALVAKLIMLAQSRQK